jgi:hypothetical protein
MVNTPLITPGIRAWDFFHGSSSGMGIGLRPKWLMAFYQLITNIFMFLSGHL